MNLRTHLGYVLKIIVSHIKEGGRQLMIILHSAHTPPYSTNETDVYLVCRTRIQQPTKTKVSKINMDNDTLPLPVNCLARYTARVHKALIAQMEMRMCVCSFTQIVLVAPFLYYSPACTHTYTFPPTFECPLWGHTLTLREH
jgi:hypothetical protein